MSMNPPGFSEESRTSDRSVAVIRVSEISRSTPHQACRVDFSVDALRLVLRTEPSRLDILRTELSPALDPTLSP